MATDDRGIHALTEIGQVFQQIEEAAGESNNSRLLT
jgi:hypothetical protein